MRSTKSTLVLIAVAVVLTYLVTGYARSLNESRERARLENLLTPVITKAVGGTTDPKPKLSFVAATEKSMTVVLNWNQKPEAAVKNDMRERVSSAIRRELAADPGSWGRHVSVIFDDEVVTQSWK